MFEQGTPPVHFALGPADHVAGPVLHEDAKLSPKSRERRNVVLNGETEKGMLFC